ncbi:hypothetical protein N7517_006105 [Penicillium concentricum]|uniref:Uncharacterized protein n=1 Tax=Penicillium concentricum TaxID=293559 RepID=A0A9W9SAS7_9EURO|nr:uncharacterized protein N7517_006105 [Penicillium concentricum]KAJ5374099.1 hypothetical protein N7517_006105 [Penicillium concentricum]
MNFLSRIMDCLPGAGTPVQGQKQRATFSDPTSEGKHGFTDATCPIKTKRIWPVFASSRKL